MNWNRWAPGWAYLKPWERAIGLVATCALIAYLLVFHRVWPHRLLTHEPAYWFLFSGYIAVTFWLSYLRRKRGYYKQRLDPMKFWEKVTIVSLPVGLAIYWWLMKPPLFLFLAVAVLVVSIEIGFAGQYWRRKRQAAQQPDHH